LNPKGPCAWPNSSVGVHRGREAGHAAGFNAPVGKLRSSSPDLSHFPQKATLTDGVAVRARS
jgi:hypothetical protein